MRTCDTCHLHYFGDHFLACEHCESFDKWNVDCGGCKFDDPTKGELCPDCEGFNKRVQRVPAPCEGCDFAEYPKHWKPCVLCVKCSERKVNGE